MDDVNTKIQSYMNDGVNEQYLELEKLEKERDLFQIELDKLKIEVRAKLDKIEKAMERDNFMTPEEALSFGLIDEVVEKRPADQE